MKNDMILERFKGVEKSVLVAMTEKEIYDLTLWEKIERALIINGYTDHEICRKIELDDIKRTGADSFTFTVVSTMKRKKNPSFFHKMAIDEIHGLLTLLEFNKF